MKQSCCLDLLDTYLTVQFTPSHRPTRQLRGGSVPLGAQRSCSPHTRESLRGSWAPGQRSRAAEQRETPKSPSLGTGTTAVPWTLRARRGGDPGFRGGPRGRESSRQRRFARRAEQGPPSLRLQLGAPGLGAGAFPRAAGRPPGCPRPPRAPCGRSRGRRDASGRKRRRPCGEGGSASALGSAPAAPGGSTAGRVGAGPPAPEAGARALGSARVWAAVGAPWAGATGRGERCAGLGCCPSSEQTCLPGCPGRSLTLSPTPRVCALCFPEVNSDSALWSLNSRAVSVDGQCWLTRAQLRSAEEQGTRREGDPHLWWKVVAGHLRGSGTEEASGVEGTGIINLLSADLYVVWHLNASLPFKLSVIWTLSVSSSAFSSVSPHRFSIGTYHLEMLEDT